MATSQLSHEEALVELSGEGRRLKIAFVVHDCNRSGGQSRYVAELATRFSRKHQVHVFANTFDIETTGIHFHKVPAWRQNALTTIMTFAVAASWSVRRDFDVIHIQGYCGSRGNVVTTHICNEAWHRALCRDAATTSWRKRLFHTITSRLERHLYANVQGCQVIAISDRVARDISELYQCTAPMDVIHHGVDLLAFSPATRKKYRDAKRIELNMSEDETAFLFVGDLQKGAIQCIRALGMLDSHLILVSNSDPKPYRILASELGCSDRITFLGATKNVEYLYAAADVFVFPTCYDSFGLVITEAMACGLPVITSREAGAAKLIRHGENGLLLNDPADHRELAEQMRFLRTDQKAANKMGVAARLSVESLSWDVVAEQTMRVYLQAQREPR
jgi:UDP-glucose:(heptosyl)LPS alpha-1,3-glucosyltransferase